MFAGVDGPEPLPDSSFTEGVYCVSGRIPALSVSDSLHRAHGLAFSPLPMPSLTPAGRFREDIPPVRPPLGPSRVLDNTLHRAAETVGSKADVLRPDRNVFFGRGSAPQPFFLFVTMQARPHPPLTSSSKPSCPLSRYRWELRVCFSH